MSKRKMQEINASSMADISFLLLIFFLVTTSMSVDKGLSRKLPPVADKTNTETQKVNERNLLYVKINGQNELLINRGGQPEQIDPKALREMAKEFIKNEQNRADWPVVTTAQFEGIPGGPIAYTADHVISVQNDVDTQYQAYLEVQNELVAAYNELRDELAMERFGKHYDALDESSQDAIKKVYPQKISEAEPKNYGGNK